MGFRLDINMIRVIFTGFHGCLEHLQDRFMALVIV